MIIRIKAITYGACKSFKTIKFDWDRMKIDTNFVTIKIAEVISDFIKNKDGLIIEHRLTYKYPPKEKDINKFRKGVSKAMLKNNGCVDGEDYSFEVEE